MTALAVGAVTGALALGARANPDPGLGGLLGTAAVACASLIGLSTVRHPWAAVPLLFVTGFSGIITVPGCNTAIQLGSPDELRGRAMSLYTWVYGGVPVGARRPRLRHRTPESVPAAPRAGRRIADRRGF